MCSCAHVCLLAKVSNHYYVSNLCLLKAAIKSKRRGKLCAGVLLFQDKFLFRTVQVSVAEAYRCGFELLSHAPYSPDLAPSDFYLFPKLKFHLRGCRYESDNDVICAVEAYLEAQTIFEKESQGYNIRGQSALIFRGTMLKNNIEIICL